MGGAVAAAALLYYAAQIFLLIFAAVLLAVLLRGLTRFVARKTGLGDAWSLLAVCLLIVGSFVGVFILAAPSVSRQARQLNEQLPASINKLAQTARESRVVQEYLAQSAQQNQQAQPQEQQQPREGTSSTTPAPMDQAGAVQGLPTPDIGAVVSQAGNVVMLTFRGLAALVIVVVLGVFLAAGHRTYIDGTISLLPRQHRPRAYQVAERLGQTLELWLKGQILALTAVGILTGLGLWALGIPMALLLGLIAGLLDFIPNFGPFLAAVPGILTALMEGTDKAAMAAGLYILIQFLEGNLITPLVQRKMVDLPPALLIATQVVLGTSVGILGIMLAAPILVVVRVLVQMLYQEDLLGEPQEGSGGEGKT